MMQLFDRVVDPNLLVRKITIGANHILHEGDVPEEVQEQPETALLFRGLLTLGAPTLIKSWRQSSVKSPRTSKNP